MQDGNEIRDFGAVWTDCARIVGSKCELDEALRADVESVWDRYSNRFSLQVLSASIEKWAEDKAVRVASKAEFPTWTKGDVLHAITKFALEYEGKLEGERKALPSPYEKASAEHREREMEAIKEKYAGPALEVIRRLYPELSYSEGGLGESVWMPFTNAGFPDMYRLYTEGIEAIGPQALQAVTSRARSEYFDTLEVIGASPFMIQALRSRNMTPDDARDQLNRRRGRGFAPEYRAIFIRNLFRYIYEKK